MKKPILNTRGGEFDYSAPTHEILSVTMERGYATSGGGGEIWTAFDPWGDETGDEVNCY